MNKLRPVDKGYIAGFFDGEGCVSIPKKIGRGKEIRLIFSQRDPKPLQRIQGLMGIGNLWVNHRQGLDGGDCWKLSIHGQQDAYDFAKVIRPHTTVKRAKLGQVIKLLEERGIS